MKYCKTRGNYRFKRPVVNLVTNLVAAVAVASGIGVANGHAAEPAQEAHDTYCIACHDTSVYTRESRLARDYDSVREQVDRWQGTINLGWTAEEIDRMTTWLAEHYYRVPCPNAC